MNRIRRSKAHNYTKILIFALLFLTAGYALTAQPLADRLETVLPDNSRFGLWYGDGSSNGNGDNGAGGSGILDWLLRNGILDSSNRQDSIRNQWNIGFIDVKKVDSKGTAMERSKATFNNLFATFDVSLANPGDSITYEFTIKNKGVINAKLDSYDIIANDNEAIKFEVENLNKGEALNVGKTKKIRITTSFDSEATTTPEVTTEKIRVVLRYVQK